MSADFRGVIHSLFAEHDKVKREVEMTDTGYRASTTSEDAEVAEMIQTHVAQMESRLEGGMGVRHWDPAFAELRAHYDDMEIAIEKIDGGIAVLVTGKTDDAIKVAKNHARIITGFVEKGGEQMHATHEAVLADSAAATTVAAAGGKGGCAECGGKGKGKDAGGCEACAGGGGPGKGKGKGAGKGSGACGQGDKPCCAAGAKSAADASGSPTEETAK